MPSPYSCDLRCRVMEYYDQYKNIDLTYKTFKISRSIVYDWIKLKKETGDIKPRVNHHIGQWS